ncbi:MAG: VWA domain-containing protein [Gammaproteobacteria bacterium]|nr:VWA domain-containing protein [Gammaproteobacteria bacterium]
MDALTHIELRHPAWLLLALQPLVVWLWASIRRRMRQDNFADAHLLPWVVSHTQAGSVQAYVRQGLLLLAWCAFAVAMAGPRTLDRIVGSDDSHALILQVVVDESYSMSARDVTPSRLQRVQLELQDLVDRLQQVRMGLIVYAARAHVMLPPTNAKTVLRHAIDDLRTRQLPTEGSDLYNALHFARQQLANASGQARAILLVSDGEVSDDTAGAQQAMSQLLAGLRQDNIQLYTLGVGTAQGAALLDDQQGWLQHDGRTVVTRLHEERLQQLAQAGNGRYAAVADDDSDWRSLYDEGIARLQSRNLRQDSTQQVIWHDLSPWFVATGFMLFLLASLRFTLSRQTSHAAVLLCMVSLGVLLHAPDTQAQETDYASAYTIYKAKQYEAAARAFARVTGYEARMGEAASRYALKQYAQAAAGYIRATLAADTDAQRASALFNLGNSYYQQQAYQQAADAYRDVLRYAPGFMAAKTNLEYALALQRKADTSPLAQAQRAGTGYHTAPAAPDTDVGKGRVSLDDSESQAAKTRGLVTDTSPHLGGKGELLQRAKPVTQQIDINKDEQWTYDITQVKEISPADADIKSDETVFWQRLYETEEDFQAPRDRPETLPGVAPW